MEVLKKFYEEEEGLEVVEMVVLMAVLVGAALIFKDQVIGFVTSMLEKIFKQSQEKFDPSTMGGSSQG